jgi:glutaconate CoA-transferase subunit B
MSETPGPVSANYTDAEMMTVAAARLLRADTVCFVGIGLPSAAANLARAMHAPDCVLIYESGTIGSKPAVLPLSIGDGELAETADAVISVPEIFAYWLQGGRVDVGFLGAAQVDRFGNINTTVVGGTYERPKVRLPGAGGAPEIASNAKEVYIIIEQGPRTFPAQLDFRTSAGYLEGGDSRARSGAPGGGPTVVITDLGILKPDPQTNELTLVALHPGVDVERARAATGWPLKVAEHLEVTPAPTGDELSALRALQARTEAAHSGAVT